MERLFNPRESILTKILCKRLTRYFDFLQAVVLILDGNSEIGAHVKSNLCYLICLRRFIRSRAVKDRATI